MIGVRDQVRKDNEQHRLTLARWRSPVHFAVECAVADVLARAWLQRSVSLFEVRVLVVS